MDSALIAVSISGHLVWLGLLLLLLRRISRSDSGSLAARLDSIDRADERLERLYATNSRRVAASLLRQRENSGWSCLS